MIKCFQTRFQTEILFIDLDPDQKLSPSFFDSYSLLSYTLNVIHLQLWLFMAVTQKIDFNQDSRSGFHGIDQDHEPSL